jgi:hypothetical protein
MNSTDDITLVNGFPIPTRSTRKKTVAVTLMFCFTLVAYLVGYGDAANSLHTSAMAWAFSLSVAVVTGYIFGAVLDNSHVIAKFNATQSDTAKSP